MKACSWCVCVGISSMKACLEVWEDMSSMKACLEVWEDMSSMKACS